MMMQVLTLWVATALGQAGTGSATADAAWLKNVPTTADVVVRGRALDEVRGDLNKMLDAMSPSLSESVKPVLEGATGQLTNQYGTGAGKTPFLLMLRLPKPDAPPPAGGLPPYAAVIKSGNYSTVQKALAGDKAEPKATTGGYDVLKGSDGQPVYTYNAKGYVVLGTDEALVGAAAKASSTLGSTLKPTVRDSLLAGDLGVYLNLKAVGATYGDQIKQMREQVLGAIAQGGAQGDPDQAKAAQAAASGLFERLKNAEAVAFHFDFDPAGLLVSGIATVAADSPAAARLGKGRTGNADRLARLPANATSYAYLNVSPEALEQLKQAGMNLMLGGGGKPNDAMPKALDLMRKAGEQETVSATLEGEGLRTIGLTEVADPKTFVESMTASFNAMAGGDNAAIKGVKVTPNAETYKDIKFNRAVVTIDVDKLAKAQPNNPKAADLVRSQFGGDTITTYYGTDGKTVIASVAKDWDTAKSQVDAALNGQGGVGQTASYKALRGKLPEKASVLVMASAQGIVRQVASRMSAMGVANAKAPTGLPKEPALLGGALVNTTDGFRFVGFVPSNVGPVFEKGLIPLLGNLGAGGANPGGAKPGGANR